ncbi:MAG TPA: fibronectin type III domain-containing protein [Verrucomicrobiales bacterium]|nr:fibronectin type III domain-containing protein [Verrucomicrobiales bacterium]
MSFLSFPRWGLRAFRSSASRFIDGTGLLLRWLRIGFFLACGIRANGDVTLEWDASNEPDVRGYRLHYGLVSGEYTEVIDAGNATSAVVPGLTVGEIYYFAVTAYDEWAMESDPSNEVVITVPEPPPPMTFRALIAEEVPSWLRDGPVELPAVFVAEGELAVEGLNSILIAGRPGVEVSVEVSGDLMEWETLATDLNATGVMVATDQQSRNWARRYYRIREIGMILPEAPPAPPPLDDPPQETPPEAPPAETPPAEPPMDDPPAELPPAEPPLETPGELPPETPPAEPPPAETPPVEPQPEPAEGD